MLKAKTNKEKGKAGLVTAIKFYGTRERYEVGLPLNDTQDFDLFIRLPNLESKTVQVKTAWEKKNGVYICNLKSCGGTKGYTYTTVKDSNADILLIVTELEELYEVPISEITQKSSVNLGPQMQKYRVDDIPTTYEYKHIPRKGEAGYIPRSSTLPDKFCAKCGAQINKRNKSGLCRQCADFKRLKCPTINKEALTAHLLTKGFSAIAREYNVTDNAIRKWCKKFGLPSNVSELKLFRENHHI